MRITHTQILLEVFMFLRSIRVTQRLETVLGRKVLQSWNELHIKPHCMLTSDSLSKNSLNLVFVAESPLAKGFTVSKLSLTSVSRPSIVVNRPPRLLCSQSNSNSGIERIAVSACHVLQRTAVSSSL